MCGRLGWRSLRRVAAALPEQLQRPRRVPSRPVRMRARVRWRGMRAPSRCAAQELSGQHPWRPVVWSKALLAPRPLCTWPRGGDRALRVLRRIRRPRLQHRCRSTPAWVATLVKAVIGRSYPPQGTRRSVRRARVAAPVRRLRTSGPGGVPLPPEPRGAPRITDYTST